MTGISANGLYLQGQIGRFPASDIAVRDALITIANMTSPDFNLLARRSREIDAELQALYDLRVVDGDPAEIEASLFAEQLEIDALLGVNYVRA